MQDVNIPEGCSSQQLFRDAEEVVGLTTSLAGLEDNFERLYLKYYSEAPTGFSDKARDMWALQQIKEHHNDLWTEIDTKRARMRGLSLKATICNAASRIVAVEQGIALHV